jgi:MFS family permease
MSVTTTTTAQDVDAPEQRTVLRVLVGAQILSGAGLAAGITVGALLARDMLDSTSMAGVPAMLFTVGSAAAAMGIGRLSQRMGRRAGLAAGYLTGAIGSAGVVAAAVLDSVPMLFSALFIYGAGSAANLQARYAGADLAAPHRRGRAVAIVLVATTLGAVAGPNLAVTMGELARSWGIPTLAGPFVLAAVAYAVGAVVLWVFLRPDPLILARDRDRAAASGAVPLPPSRAQSRAATKGIATGALVMIVAQMVMIALMTMTPVHMAGHGHAVGAVGFVIGVHVAAMFLPSPLSGWLVDRWGAETVAVLSAVTFAISAAVGAFSPPESLVLLTLSLALLGLGWSFGLVAGTALVTDAAPVAQRARVQGNVDFLIALAGAAGGGISGVVVATADYTALALGGGVLAVILVPVMAATRPRRSGSDVGSAL